MKKLFIIIGIIYYSNVSGQSLLFKNYEEVKSIMEKYEHNINYTCIEENDTAIVASAFDGLIILVNCIKDSTNKYIPDAIYRIYNDKKIYKEDLRILNRDTEILGYLYWVGYDKGGEAIYTRSLYDYEFGNYLLSKKVSF